MITHEQLIAWHSDWALSSDDNDSFGEYIAKRAYEQGKKDAIPDGWQLVPKEPTDDMLDTGYCSTSQMECWGHAKAVYQAILAAAPKAKL